MKIVNSISGGKTSAYIAKHYPADINIFSLVTLESRKCLWMNGKDEATRKLISDRIGKEFIGTAEMDEIIYTILDLEQFIGNEIKIVYGDSFEQVIQKKGGYLPNQMTRFCTVEMKLKPIFNYLESLDILPVEMNIGYRPNEIGRADRMLERAGVDGIELFERMEMQINGRNKKKHYPYRIAKFPLIYDNVSKDIIYQYWEDKPVRFAYRNNCVGCVNRNPLFVSHMATKERNKIEWMQEQEEITGNRFFKGTKIESILKFKQQGNLFQDEDFSSCDGGYCGI